MNDASNDGNEATEGILADLANLQQSVNTADSANGDVDESIREKLDHIAEAAGSLRLQSPMRTRMTATMSSPSRNAVHRRRHVTPWRTEDWSSSSSSAIPTKTHRTLQTHRRPRVLSGGVKRTIPRRPTTLRMTPLQTPNRLRRRSILAIPSPRRQPSLRPRRHREALLQCLTMAA